MGCVSSKDSAADTDHSLPTRTPAQKGNSSAAGPTERLSSTQLSNRGKANGQCHETNSRPAGEKGVDEERVLDQLRLERLLVADRNGKHSHSFSGPTGYAIQHAVLPSKEKEEAGFVSLAAVQVGLPVEGKPETGGVDKPISLADRDLSIQQHLGRRRSSWAALTGPADRSPVASGRSPRKSAGLPIPEDMQDLHGATDIGIGGRGDNQDSYATSVFRDDRGVETALAAVFDGHGPEGSRCSNLCASKLKETFDEQRDLEVQSAFFAPSTKSVMSGSFTRTVWNQGAQSATSFGSSCSNRGELLKQEFLDREERLLHLLFYSLEERLKEACNTVMSGTTASLCLLKPRKAWMASVGDSTAILISQGQDGEHTATTVTADHRLSNEEEKKRVISAGARVARKGSHKSKGHLRNAEMDIPGLMVTRSLGDNVGKSVGVISEPHVTHVFLRPHDRYIVIGTDGLWDALSHEDIIRIVTEAPSSKAASNLLIQEALSSWEAKKADAEQKAGQRIRGMGDNITAVVVNLNKWVPTQNLGPSSKDETTQGDQ
uniref:PPM-type phosphatase domain-containing protein n=1 Tax=Tetraselmis sp. GSL018 TaxID=582737 RepID=A0A061QXU8_9CHLO|eukprot:CAMPEP_0177607800 /NCGR_PEP_ID=MMETSP0419_2-20121207/18117_1 /TAXON_ID=582737 /ORGANISM="Tetraselmis sp., Strain GSL018" /LENGTH=545 /DNA_ID=CAMNT_0019102419 /DNA_START=195 /DNA_END=1832 /DNA_ORIENTATION=+